MDTIIVIIGLFIFFAIYSNKDIRKDKKNDDVYTWFAIIVLFAVLSGLGFLFQNPMGSTPSYALLIPMQIGFATVAVTSKGWPGIFSRVCTIAVFAFLIMASFR